MQAEGTAQHRSATSAVPDYEYHVSVLGSRLWTNSTGLAHSWSGNGSAVNALRIQWFERCLYGRRVMRLRVVVSDRLQSYGRFLTHPVLWLARKMIDYRSNLSDPAGWE
jgi:hypothetical protein